MTEKKQESIMETHDLVVYPIKLVVAIGKGLEETINRRYVSPDEEYKDATIAYSKDCDACTCFLQDRRTGGALCPSFGRRNPYGSLSQRCPMRPHMPPLTSSSKSTPPLTLTTRSRLLICKEP